MTPSTGRAAVLLGRASPAPLPLPLGTCAAPLLLEVLGAVAAGGAACCGREPARAAAPPLGPAAAEEAEGGAACCVRGPVNAVPPEEEEARGLVGQLGDCLAAATGGSSNGGGSGATSPPDAARGLVVMLAGGGLLPEAEVRSPPRDAPVAAPPLLPPACCCLLGGACCRCLPPASLSASHSEMRGTTEAYAGRKGACLEPINYKHLCERNESAGSQTRNWDDQLDLLRVALFPLNAHNLKPQDPDLTSLI